MDDFCCFYEVYKVVVFNSNFPLEEGNIQMEYADCRYISFSKTFILVTYQWHQHTDATWKFWCIQVTGLIEHKVQLDVFQMLLLLLLSIIYKTVIGMRLSKTSVISWTCWSGFVYQLAIEVDQYHLLVNQVVKYSK